MEDKDNAKGKGKDDEEEVFEQSFETTIFNIARNVLVQITAIRNRIRTLTDWYIYPNPIPTEILAYDPRLALLAGRLEQLQTLSTSNLDILIQSWETIVVTNVNTIFDQLVSALYSLEEIFVNHYDPDLRERKAFGTIHKVLEHTSTQLVDISLRHATGSRSLMPAKVRPGQDAYFCRGAIRIINGSRLGRIDCIRDDEPQREDYERLKQSKGGLLCWCCPDCAFRLPFHFPGPGPMNNSVYPSDEIRTHDGINLSYRPSFLVKAHLRQSIVREWYAGELSQVPQYGCVFCFSVGKPLQQGTSSDPSGTIFRSAMDLAAHTSENHRSPPPPGLLLHKFRVAFKGNSVDGKPGWDVNFL